MAENFLQYRGQWGGRIDSGEEMWWSEPDRRLSSGRRGRLKFFWDVRHHFLLRFWKKAFGDHRDLKVADFGCGTGGTTLNFSRVLGVPIHGLDVFETQLKIARDFARAEGIPCEFSLIGKDGRTKFQDGELDAIFSLDVLGHVPEIPSALREWARVLKRGGHVLLFTESHFSAGDSSIAARLARRGQDIFLAVPEHISLHPRETLEKWFAEAGFRIEERFSANVAHFFFFPKDYVLYLKGKKGFKGWYWLAWIWNRISKLVPFYPRPFEALRLVLTYLFGRSADGTAYFYHLVRR